MGWSWWTINSKVYDYEKEEEGFQNGVTGEKLCNSLFKVLVVETTKKR